MFSHFSIVTELIKDNKYQQLQLETMKWARAWCIIAAIYELIQRVYTNYSEYRRKKIERVMRRTCAMKLNKKWLAIMKRKGATLEARQGRTVKYCL